MVENLRGTTGTHKVGPLGLGFLLALAPSLTPEIRIRIGLAEVFRQLL